MQAAMVAPAPNLPPALAERLAAVARCAVVAPQVPGLGPLFRVMQPLPPPGGVAGPGAPPIAAPLALLGLLNRPEEAARRLLDLPEAVLGRIRGGEGIVAFDGASEGRGFAPVHAQSLHAALDAAGIAPGRAAWLQQNRRLRAPYEAFCAAQGIAPLRIVTADSYGFALWDRLAGRRPRGWRWGFALARDGARRHRWICLNYMLRPHRALVALWLMDRAEPGHLSLSTQRETIDASWRARFLDAVGRLAPEAPQEAMARAGGLVDSGLHLGHDTDAFAHPQERVFSLPVAEVADAELFIVTETEMAGTGLARWTEKTLKALASGLPFIVFGNQGTIAGLEALGFDPLRDLVDHGYDRLAAPAARFAAARQAVARFLDRPAGFSAAEMARLRDASGRNREVFAREMPRVSMLEPLDAVLGMLRG